ncbi:MAG: fructosamine kinase [Chloroflexi bacterium]|nr:MAG: fructosamine kinase [Chloroflexota bacterium]
MTDLRSVIKQITGLHMTRAEPLTGGCVGQVYRVHLSDGTQMVAKVDEQPEPCLHIEGFMLTYLKTHSRLPVPEVYYSAPDLLLMSWLPGQSHFSARAQAHAAELLADLHSVSAPAFGLEQDTLIGGLRQPNPWTQSWITFFREHRLAYMAEEALRAGQLSQSTWKRLARFWERLDEWLEEPERPSLIHGDVWTTNVLAVGDRITGFIDPAIYYGHPEIELAFTTLFGTFGDPFFRRYMEIRPLSPGFFEMRRDIYNLYPLLVHVRLFGAMYEQSIVSILRRFGF